MNTWMELRDPRASPAGHSRRFAQGMAALTLLAVATLGFWALAIFGAAQLLKLLLT